MISSSNWIENYSRYSNDNQTHFSPVQHIWPGMKLRLVNRNEQKIRIRERKILDSNMENLKKDKNHKPTSDWKHLL